MLHENTPIICLFFMRLLPRAESATFFSRHAPHTGAIALWEHKGSYCFETFLAIFELHRKSNYDVSYTVHRRYMYILEAV